MNTPLKIPGRYDEPAGGLALSSALETHLRHCVVTTADSVPAARHLLLTNEYALVISDVLMLEGNGFDVLRFAKRLRPHTPVILVTGATPISHEEARHAGAYALLEKPFTLQQFISVVNEALRTLPPVAA